MEAHDRSESAGKRRGLGNDSGWYTALRSELGEFEDGRRSIYIEPGFSLVYTLYAGALARSIILKTILAFEFCQLV